MLCLQRPGGDDIQPNPELGREPMSRGGRSRDQCMKRRNVDRSSGTRKAISRSGGSHWTFALDRDTLLAGSVAYHQSI